MKFVNLTGHDINLATAEGVQVIPGDKARTVRVIDSYGEFDADGVCTVSYGSLIGAPEPEDGVLCIVSALVLAAGRQLGRSDFVAPATGHPAAVKNEKGHVLSVPGFVR